MADQASLTLAALIPFVLFKLDFQYRSRSLWVVLAIVPLALFPLIQYSVKFLQDAWMFLYVALILTGLCIFFTRRYQMVLISFVVLLSVWFVPYEFKPNQVKYYDQLIQTFSTRTGEADLVRWRNGEWMYYNSSLLLTSVDGHMHSETLVHTTLPYFDRARVLLIGDEHGMTSQELHKYESKIDHVPYDYELVETRNGNQSTKALFDANIFDFLESNTAKYDVIIVDLPDPEHLPFKKFYESYFYELVTKCLSEDGIFMTNAGGYYTDSKHHDRIVNEVLRAGLVSQRLQALVPTLGHRVWVWASKKNRDLRSLEIEKQTRWINSEAIELMLSNGKSNYPF